ncbi:Xyloglucan endotransglucosylase protein 1 [Orobanche gracilis]
MASVNISSTSALFSLVASLLLVAAFAGNFNQDVDVYFGGPRASILQGGNLLTLSLDQSSGSGFLTKKEFMFGRFDMQMKLVPGNSAGTVTTFYLSSQGEGHDEIDFEFLGNSSGQPYTVHTNVFAQGKGGREQQFKLWFDPTTSFHTYSIVWNYHRIIFLVDNNPIRVYESNGNAFPKDQPMKVYCSLWNADDWATQGGRVKTDWTNAPFMVSYRNFNANGCVRSTGSSTCDSTDSANNDQTWQTLGLDAKGRNMMKWLRQRSVIYNYCTDTQRFPQGFPPECKQQ